MLSFIHLEDKRLEEKADFEIQKIDENDEIVHSDRSFEEKTFNELFDMLAAKYGNGIMISLLEDNDGLLQATITPMVKTVSYHYCIISD